MSNAETKQITITASTSSSYKSEQIQSVSPGNTGSPFTECVGADDYDTICLMEFSGTSATPETVTFQWESGSALNEEEDIVVYVYGMIQVAPTAETPQVKFGLKFYGTDGTDPIITSDTTTIGLYDGGAVVWPQYAGTGSPYATTGVVNYFTIEIAAGRYQLMRLGRFHFIETQQTRPIHIQTISGYRIS